jgi:outer membrane protein assembly factor BamB
VADDAVVVCTRTGVVSVLDAESGELRWEYDAGEQIVASPAVVKDHFYILTSRGTLLCFGEDEK